MSTSINIRSTFLPDEGCVMVRCDLSQIEHRMCMMYCGTPRTVDLANKKPTEYDAHTENAKLIFRKQEISKQERYLGKKCVHGCVDGQTEVLTKRGWVRIPLLTKWDVVAQWEMGGEITFVKPEKIHHYVDDVKMLRFRNGNLSQLITDNHRVVYITNGNLKVCEASELPKGAMIPLNGFYSGGIKMSKTLVRLIVAAQADSTFTENGGIRWRLKKTRKIERLEALLMCKALDYTKARRKDNVIDISLGVKEANEICYWLPGKKFSPMLFDWDGESLDTLISELPYWDGGFNEKCASFVYRSSDKDNIDIVQAIAHMRRKKATINEVQPTESSYRSTVSYNLNINDRHNFANIERPHIEHKEQFNIYCLTVDTGFFVIRRNGAVSITGNSERMMGGYRMSESISKDTKGELYVHPRQCDQLLDAFYAAMPEIKGIYFPWVERQVRSVGVLVTSWGRKLPLGGRRIDKDIYKEAYSYYLQAEAADWTNQYLFIPTYHYMMGRYGKAPNGQVHDEAIACVPLEDAWDLVMFMQTAAQQTREIPRGSGNYLTVPAEVSVGRSWGDKEAVEFKEVPGKGEFYEQLKDGGFQRDT